MIFNYLFCIGDIIFDEFFIRFSDLLINVFIRIIDIIINFLNNFNNENNDAFDDSYERSYVDSDDEMNGNRKEIFKISDFLRNDNIFEELEKKYSENSSSDVLNPSKKSNIFTSLNIEKNENGSLSNQNYDK